MGSIAIAGGKRRPAAREKALSSYAHPHGHDQVMADSLEDHTHDDGVEERSLLVLYATETGNSLDIAERVAREARRHHFHTRVMSMDDYPLVNTTQTLQPLAHGCARQS